ncbi:MAG: hypothetical protein R3243_16480 [Arenibacter latericius]|nr:hypothetical protein [Arenibacter latericius]
MEKNKETVIKELRELFEISNRANGSMEHDGKFLVNKMHMERPEVIDKLQNYFNCTTIKDGYVSVGSISFVYTDFCVCDGSPE